MLPLTREDNFLAKIAGDPDADESMKPRTRKEYFLNQIAENGGGGGGGTGGGVLIVNMDEDTFTLDKTWQEITNALGAGTVLIVPYPETQERPGATIDIITSTSKGDYEEGVYYVWRNFQHQDTWCLTDSADGYPIMD